MSEGPVTPRITVGYERSISVRPYETAKASIFVQADVVGTWSEDGLFVPDKGAVSEAAKAAFFEAKVAVLSQLNLKFEVTQEQIVLEMLDKHLGPIDIVAEPTHVTRTPPMAAPASAAKSSKADKEADLLANPAKWWDNRVGKTNPKAPDFKHKDSGEGIWLDKASPALKEAYGLPF